MRWSLWSAAVVAVMALVIPAHAKTKHDSPYTFQQTFGSAVRLLKVDLGFEVTERDLEMGYVLFLYTSPESGERKSRGSISFVEAEERVQVNLQIPDMPSYHEQVLMEKLRHKLEDEHGDPPPPPEAPKPKEPKKPEKDEDEPSIPIVGDG